MGSRPGKVTATWPRAHLIFSIRQQAATNRAVSPSCTRLSASLKKNSTLIAPKPGAIRVGSRHFASQRATSSKQQASDKGGAHPRFYRPAGLESSAHRTQDPGPGLFSFVLADLFSAACCLLFAAGLLLHNELAQVAQERFRRLRVQFHQAVVIMAGEDAGPGFQL